jgi:hypothetical protein
MKHLVSTDVAKARLAKWLMKAQPVSPEVTWTERRMAIKFGGHTYLVEKDQIFQCAHCGRFDPQWNTTEVLNFFFENFDVKPEEIEVVCSVAAPDAGQE